eukprot:Skav215236  [mRNA]  locus=scaffold341:363046:363378:- [translate_table: standard]
MGKGGQSGKPGFRCFKCDGPHLARDCPRAKESRFAEEEVHFDYRAKEMDGAEWVCPVWDGNFTEKIAATKGMMDTRYRAIDSGAAASLGSIQATEAVMMKNLGGHGNSRY